MDFNTYLLVAAALLPAIVLAVYVFKKDRVEKEPLGLLLLLLGLGALSCFPAAILEEVLLGAISAIFSPLMIEQGGQLYLSGPLYYIYHACENFIGIALIEEGLKWLILFFVTRKNKNFTHLFDGVVYAVFISLGFAALENVKYVTAYGFFNAITRGILSVPGHMFFGVFMGYYFSQWNVLCIARESEEVLGRNGFLANVTPVDPSPYLKYSLFVPVMIHGFYDFALSVDSWIMTIAFIVFIAAMYYVCFSKVKKISDLDGEEGSYAMRVLCTKYPYLKEKLEEFASAKNIKL